VVSRALRMVLGLLLLYGVGWGYYARFWRDKSPVFMGCLAVFGWSGGLTGLRGRRGASRGWSWRNWLCAGKQFVPFDFAQGSACGCTPAFGRAVSTHLREAAYELALDAILLSKALTEKLKKPYSPGTKKLQMLLPHMLAEARQPNQ
jgi:hypothetical protein